MNTNCFSGLPLRWVFLAAAVFPTVVFATHPKTRVTAHNSPVKMVSSAVPPEAPEKGGIRTCDNWKDNKPSSGYVTKNTFSQSGITYTSTSASTSASKNVTQTVSLGKGAGWIVVLHTKDLDGTTRKNAIKLCSDPSCDGKAADGHVYLKSSQPAILDLDQASLNHLRDKTESCGYTSGINSMCDVISSIMVLHRVDQNKPLTREPSVACDKDDICTVSIESEDNVPHCDVN